VFATPVSPCLVRKLKSMFASRNYPPRCVPFRRLLECLVVLLTAACSHMYVSPDGTHHVIGFVHLELPAANPAVPWGGESLRVQSLGITMSSGNESRALVIGYSDATHVAVRDNTCFAPGFALMATPTPAPSSREKE